MEELIVGPVSHDEQSRWRELYRGYASFYGVPMNAEMLARIWSWVIDPKVEFHCLASRRGGKMEGFAHVRPFLSPLDAAMDLFLDDLFVDPAQRGEGHGRALLDAVAKEAAKRGCRQIQWLTADDNYAARRLYDQVAKRTYWITYQMAPTS